MKRPTDSQLNVALIIALVIVSFTAVDARRQASSHASQIQRAALTVQMDKVCKVLRCDQESAK